MLSATRPTNAWQSSSCSSASEAYKRGHHLMAPFPLPLLGKTLQKSKLLLLAHTRAGKDMMLSSQLEAAYPSSCRFH